jgi:anaerobic selenocysteine-containing dehydrogenase
MSRLGRLLLEEQPPVRVLFVYDANPAVTLPDQHRVQAGLLREDLFTVVFDPVLTDTARYADIVLPATTFLEQRELSASYGTYSLLLSEPVIAPCGESLPNEVVFARLLERLGYPAGPLGEPLLDGAIAAVTGPLAGDAAGRAARLRHERIARFDFPGERPVQFGTVWPGTPDRKVNLWPAGLGADPYAVLADPGDLAHPLALISPSSDKTICSTLGELDEAPIAIELHPHDAAARGLRDGQRVRAYNALGEIVAAVHLSEGLRPGVVMIPKGKWMRASANGAVASALVPDGLSGPGAGACFNDARIQIVAAS